MSALNTPAITERLEANFIQAGLFKAFAVRDIELVIAALGTER